MTQLFTTTLLVLTIALTACSKKISGEGEIETFTKKDVAITNSAGTELVFSNSPAIVALDLNSLNSSNVINVNVKDRLTNQMSTITLNITDAFKVKMTNFVKLKANSDISLSESFDDGETNLPGFYVVLNIFKDPGSSSFNGGTSCTSGDGKFSCSPSITTQSGYYFFAISLFRNEDLIKNQLEALVRIEGTTPSYGYTF